MVNDFTNENLIKAFKILCEGIEKFMGVNPSDDFYNEMREKVEEEILIRMNR